MICTVVEIPSGLRHPIHDYDSRTAAECIERNLDNRWQICAVIKDCPFALNCHRCDLVKPRNRMVA